MSAHPGKELKSKKKQPRKRKLKSRSATSVSVKRVCKNVGMERNRLGPQEKRAKPTLSSTENLPSGEKVNLTLPDSQSAKVSSQLETEGSGKAVFCME